MRYFGPGLVLVRGNGVLARKGGAIEGSNRTFSPMARFRMTKDHKAGVKCSYDFFAQELSRFPLGS